MSEPALTKWYLDCVDELGNLCIASWARVVWKSVSVAVCSVLTERDGDTKSKTHLTSLAPPVVSDSLIEWDARPFGLQLSMRRRTKAYSEQLIDGVEWNCEMPAADAVIRFSDGAEMRGFGYAEVLQMRIAARRLPIDELRWGRFVGAKSSVVWIDWRGSHPLTRVLSDGVRATEVRVGDRLIEADGRTFEIADNRTVRDASVAETLGGIRAVAPLLPKGLMNAHETKWRARLTVKEQGSTIDSGWAIHELVKFA